MYIRQLILIIGLFSCSSLFAQKKVEKIKEVIIANNQIVSFKEVETFAKNGQLKGMHKGVSQEKRDSLYAIHGDKIGDKEFITIIELKTEKTSIKKERVLTQTINLDSARLITNFILTEGKVAADFNVEMIDGKQLSLSNLKGKVVLINFWATWCAPCLKEFIEIPEKILEENSDKDFVFIPIAIGQDKETVAKKMEQMKKYGVEFNVGYDEQKHIWNQYAIGSIPKNFLIDKNGVIRLTTVGYSKNSVDEMATKIQQLLKE